MRVLFRSPERPAAAGQADAPRGIIAARLHDEVDDPDQKGRRAKGGQHSRLTAARHRRRIEQLRAPAQRELQDQRHDDTDADQGDRMVDPLPVEETGRMGPGLTDAYAVHRSFSPVEYVLASWR